jgi:hypothetical protein
MLAVALVVIALAPWPDPFEETYAPPHAPEGEPVEFRPAPARPWVDAVRAMREETPAKQQYVGFLKDRYGYNIGALNAAYGLEAGSFTELGSYDYRRLDREREAVRRDDAAFLRILTEAATAAARRKR